MKWIRNWWTSRKDRKRSKEASDREYIAFFDRILDETRKTPLPAAYYSMYRKGAYRAVH